MNPRQRRVHAFLRHPAWQYVALGWLLITLSVAAIAVVVRFP